MNACQVCVDRCLYIAGEENFTGRTLEERCNDCKVRRRRYVQFETADSTISPRECERTHGERDTHTGTRTCATERHAHIFYINT